MADLVMFDRGSADLVARATRKVLYDSKAGQWNFGTPRDNGFGGGWNGIIIQKLNNGVQWSGTPAGTPTSFIRIHYADELAFLVEYSDGTDLQNWPDKCQVYDITQVSGAITVP